MEKVIDTSERKYVIVNSCGEFLRKNSGPSQYGVHFTKKIQSARLYASSTTAAEMLFEYSLAHDASVLAIDINTSYSYDMSETQTPEERFEKELDEFEVLNVEFNRDAERMSEKKYRRWVRLRDVLRSAQLLHKERVDGVKVYTTIREH